MDPEIIQFTLSEKDCKEIFRAEAPKGSNLIPFMLFMANFSIFSAIILKSVFLSASFAGVFVCMLGFLITLAIGNKERLKTYVSNTANLVFQYKIFENHFDVEIYRNKELIRYYKTYFIDTNLFSNLGNYYSINAYYSFILPKKEFSESTVFLNYMEKHPEKVYLPKRVAIIQFLNNLASHLMVPAILCGFSADPNWGKAALWLAICAAPIILTALILVLTRYRNRLYCLTTLLRLLVCSLLLSIFS